MSLHLSTYQLAAWGTVWIDFQLPSERPTGPVMPIAKMCVFFFRGSSLVAVYIILVPPSSATHKAELSVPPQVASTQLARGICAGQDAKHSSWKPVHHDDLHKALSHFNSRCSLPWVSAARRAYLRRPAAPAAHKAEFPASQGRRGPFDMTLSTAQLRCALEVRVCCQSWWSPRQRTPADQVSKICKDSPKGWRNVKTFNIQRIQSNHAPRILWSHIQHPSIDPLHSRYFIFVGYYGISYWGLKWYDMKIDCNWSILNHWYPPWKYAMFTAEASPSCFTKRPKQVCSTHWRRGSWRSAGFFWEPGNEWWNMWNKVPDGTRKCWKALG